MSSFQAFEHFCLWGRFVSLVFESSATAVRYDALLHTRGCRFLFCVLLFFFLGECYFWQRNVWSAEIRDRGYGWKTTLWHFASFGGFHPRRPLSFVPNIRYTPRHQYHKRWSICCQQKISRDRQPRERDPMKKSLSHPAQKVSENTNPLEDVQFRCCVPHSFVCASGKAAPQILVKRGAGGAVWAKCDTSSWTKVECEDAATVDALRKAIKAQFSRMLESWDAAQLTITLENGVELDPEASVAAIQ